ncbi:hypothetical protein D3C73_1516250 [compost metagenome]
MIAGNDIDRGAQLLNSLQLGGKLRMAACFTVVRQITAQDQKFRLLLLCIIHKRFHQLIAVGQHFTIPAGYIALKGCSAVL